VAQSVVSVFASYSGNQSSIPWPSQTKRLEKLVFTASLHDVQHIKGLVWR